MGCGSSTASKPNEVEIPKPVEEAREVDFKTIHSKVRWNRDFDEIKEALFSIEAVNCVDPKNGNTPLHIAAQNGHYEVTKLLIERKANVNAQNLKGNTALHMALSYDYDKCVKLIVDAGANLKLLNSSGFPADKGLEGDKSLALLAVLSSKTTEDIKSAFKQCISKKDDITKASFVASGLKTKKVLGTDIWTSDVQEEFKKIMDSFPE